MSRFVASSACRSMNSRRGSTASPMSVVNMSSASAMSSACTSSSVRFAGSMVVLQSCSGFISPSPLYRWISSPFDAARFTVSTSSMGFCAVCPAAPSFVVSAYGAFPSSANSRRSRCSSAKSGPLRKTWSTAVSQIEKVRIQRRVVLQVDLLLALRDAVERRLRDVQMVFAGAFLRLPRHHVVHLPVEEREQQRADVAAVHVGIRHQDDLVVAQFLDVELVVDAGADRRDHGGDLLRREHLVEARLLDVEDLAAQGKDRLRAPIAALLRRPACGVSLDDVELALLGVALLAVSQLARQRRRVERALPADGLARLSRRNARASRIGHLRHHSLRNPGIALPVLRQLAPDEILDDALGLGVAELALEVAFELRAGELHRDDGGEAFADVLARG